MFKGVFNCLEDGKRCFVGSWGLFRNNYVSDIVLVDVLVLGNKGFIEFIMFAEFVLILISVSFAFYDKQIFLF